MATITDIERMCRFLCDAGTTASTSAYAAADLLIAENQAYEEITAKILGADGRWDFDDTNFTTFPIATTTLVASQQDYGFDTSQLKIIGVSVKDKDGNFYKLKPFDPDDLERVYGNMFDRTEF